MSTEAHTIESVDSSRGRKKRRGGPREPAVTTARKKKKWWHHLYVWVLFGIGTGVLVGVVFPDFASELRWLAQLFINLVKMVIAPTIFATVVVGIAGLGNLAKAGGLAFRTVVYFNVTTVFALGLGLIVINVFRPGAGLGYSLDSFDGSAADATIESAGAAAGGGLPDFILGLVPQSFVGAFTGGQLLQVLLLAILVAVAITMLGKRGEKIVWAMDAIAKVMFGVIKIVMWVAPIGAFGGIAFTVGRYGSEILGSLAFFMGTFWLACLIFVFLVLGPIAAIAGFNVFKYLRYIKDELLIVLGTSSSESVLPRMISRMKQLGCKESVVGLVIPTGYSFNLDGTCIYLTMCAVFLAQATNVELSLAQQIGILAILLLTSKGAAGVTGSGFIVLAATLASTGTIDVNAMAIILGIDRFMSEARALTNLIGNGVATVVVSKLEGALDEERMHAELDQRSTAEVS